MAVAVAAAYADGELVVSLDDASSGDRLRARDDEIVVIAKETSAADGTAVYRVTWLRETPDGDDTDAERPFELSTVLLAEAAGEQLPRHLLDRHLLTEVPAAFRSALGSSAGSSATSSPPHPPSLHVVVSTHSGVGQAQAFYDGVLAPLLGHFRLLPATADACSLPSGYGTYNLLVTSSSRSVSELAQSLRSTTIDAEIAPTVILLSGDGGVVDLLNGLAVGDGADGASRPREQQLPTIALLPLGTGNALFHSLHRQRYEAAAAAADRKTSKDGKDGTSPLVLGLRTLLHGRAAPLPNFEARFAPGSRTVSYSGEAKEAGETVEAQLQEHVESVTRLRGAIVASYGFHAQLVWESDTPEYRRHGAKRFGMAAQELLKISHAYAADVETSAAGLTKSSEPQRLQPLGHRFNYVLATMVSNLEKTFTISPASRPLDGELRLVHFGAVGGARTMEAMMAAYNNGTHVGMKWPADEGVEDAKEEETVGYEAIDELKITVHELDSRWRKVCIDGTIVELPRDGWMSVRKATQPVLRIITDAV